MDQVNDNLVIVPTKPLPERRFIEDKERTEIVRVFNEFHLKQKSADVARHLFLEVVNTVRREKGIPDNESWDIADDASYFEKTAPVLLGGVGEAV